MSKHWRYLKYVCKHKWFVFRAGLRIGGIPIWRLIIHDYSKFSRAEWTPYANRFFSDKSHDPEEFSKAWLHHIHKNPHHWEHWCIPEIKDHTVQMPDHFAREMVADWLGAGRAIKGSWDIMEWYVSTNHKRIMHYGTRSIVAGYVNLYGRG